MNRQPREQPSGEPHLAKLNARVKEFEAELIALMQPDAEWKCVKCGHALDHDGWVSPRTLREQIETKYREGALLSIAVMNLVRDGTFEQNSRFGIRLAGVPA